MENFESISIDIKENILTIHIGTNTDTSHIDYLFIKELKTLLNKVYNDEAIKGVIITGKGEEIFSTGLGIEELEKLQEMNGRKYSEEGQEVLGMIEQCPKPIIAAINGIAEGTGCELALACHIRLATESAYFRMPELYLGLLPCFGGTQRLPQIVGKGKALELMLTGYSIDAAEAMKIGLVNQLLTYKDSMIKRAFELVNRINKNSTLSVGMLIDCVNAYYNESVNGYQTESNSFEHCCNTDFFKEKLRREKDNESETEI